MEMIDTCMSDIEKHPRTVTRFVAGIDMVLSFGSFVTLLIFVIKTTTDDWSMLHSSELQSDSIKNSTLSFSFPYSGVKTYNDLLILWMFLLILLLLACTKGIAAYFLWISTMKKKDPQDAAVFFYYWIGINVAVYIFLGWVLYHRYHGIFHQTNPIDGADFYGFWFLLFLQILGCCFAGVFWSKKLA